MRLMLLTIRIISENRNWVLKVQKTIIDNLNDWETNIHGILESDKCREMYIYTTLPFK